MKLPSLIFAIFLSCFLVFGTLGCSEEHYSVQTEMTEDLSPRAIDPVEPHPVLPDSAFPDNN